MAEIVFAFALPRGKEGLDRQTMEEMTGPHRDEYVAAMKDAGMTRQAVWHQQMPDGGTLAIVYIEASDRDAARRFASDDAEFSRWFTQQMLEGYGRHVVGPPLPVELISDVRV